MHITIPSDVKRLLDALSQAGRRSFVVGGCVRDALLGRPIHDWDICTAATPDEGKAIFAGYRVLDTGSRHGTITVRIGSSQYEITTFRRDGAYSDNRRPDSVSFVNDVETDLGRRDFTINAMAYSPQEGLIDPYGGEADLRRGQICCVGDADTRFCEDGLRILRALRFAATLDFTIAAETADSIHRNKSLLANIASERCAAELNKLLLGGNVKYVLLTYADVMTQLIPEIGPCVGFDQRNRHHYLPVWEHMVETVDAAPKTLVLRLAMLLHDIGKPACFVCGDDGIGHYYGHPEVSARMAADILHRLRYDNATVEQVQTLVRYHDAEIAATGKSVRRWMHKIGPDTFRNLLAVKRADALAHVNPQKALDTIRRVQAIMDDVLASRECFSLRDMAVTGDDVAALGVPQGPAIGAVLDKLLQMVIDGAIANDRAALLDAAKAMIQRP